MSNHVFLYSPDARIEIENVKSTEDKIEEIKVLTKDGRIPRGVDFCVSVDLPIIRPKNVVPIGKDVPSSVLLQAIVLDAPKLTDVTATTRLTVGVPLNNPQRKHRHKGKKELKHQTFRFAALNFAHAMNKAVIVFHSVHRFFDDGMVNFQQARLLVQKEEGVAVV